MKDKSATVKQSPTHTHYYSYRYLAESRLIHNYTSIVNLKLSFHAIGTNFGTQTRPWEHVVIVQEELRIDRVPVLWTLDTPTAHELRIKYETRDVYEKSRGGVNCEERVCDVLDFEQHQRLC